MQRKNYPSGTHKQTKYSMTKNLDSKLKDSEKNTKASAMIDLKTPISKSSADPEMRRSEILKK